MTSLNHFFLKMNFEFLNLFILKTPKFFHLNKFHFIKIILKKLLFFLVLKGSFNPQILIKSFFQKLFNLNLIKYFFLLYFNNLLFRIWFPIRQHLIKKFFILKFILYHFLCFKNNLLSYNKVPTILITLSNYFRLFFILFNQQIFSNIYYFLIRHI